MIIRPIHPFPARMAPDLALGALASLPKGSIVLDPMAGSGTVLRQAVSLGHRAVGFDADPLAVLMTKVWTKGVSASDIRREYARLVAEAELVDLRSDRLPWVHDDHETAEFINYWFGPAQRRSLQRLAFVLHKRRQARLGMGRRAAIDFLTVALSRIIITKDQCASLARDTSHSRPHKVADDSNYDVFAGFKRSVDLLLTRMPGTLPGIASVEIGDARKIPLKKASVDAVLTSPPYLNAIDYMRGHRLSLVWFGYQLKELRAIRSDSIGAERAKISTSEQVNQISSAMVASEGLSTRCQSMVQRYAHDSLLMSSEINRVLRPGGSATLVVGNSCLKGSFIKNAEGVKSAGVLSGLEVVSARERELPSTNRYLPITLSGALSKRMRTETVLTFRKP